MPVKITKLKGGKFRVRTPGGVKSKATTKEKAEAQKRIIQDADKKKHKNKKHR